MSETFEGKIPEMEKLPQSRDRYYGDKSNQWKRSIEQSYEAREERIKERKEEYTKKNEYATENILRAEYERRRKENPGNYKKFY